MGFQGFERFCAACGKAKQSQIAKPHGVGSKEEWVGGSGAHGQAALDIWKVLIDQATTFSATASTPSSPISQSVWLMRRDERLRSAAKSNRVRSASCDGATAVMARNTFSTRPGVLRSQSPSICLIALRCRVSCEPQRLHGMTGKPCCRA